VYPIAVSFPAVGAVDGDRGGGFPSNYTRRVVAVSVKLFGVLLCSTLFEGVEVKRLRLLRDATIP